MGNKRDFTGAVDEKAADEIFGRPEVPPSPPVSPNLIARPISIHEIAPDPKQPRRQIPSIVRQQWSGDAAMISELFRAWVGLFAEESEREFGDIEAIIDRMLEGEELSPAEVYQGEKADPKRHWGVIGGSLMAVVNLAAEIRRDGLTNPITIVRVGNQFLIETGERRWLAFHLLNIFYPDSVAWNQIPARAVTASSVWRQASENTARAQLNAISMARQLAILLMDLYADDDWMLFDELVWQGACDRAYYAQVADGNRWRVPRGKGEQLVNAMGITNPVQLRQYRDLLRLPNEVWILADDLGWEEGFIRRQIVEKAVNESGMIALAQFEAESLGYRVTDSSHTVTHVTVSDDEGDPAREEIEIQHELPAPELPNDETLDDDVPATEIEPVAAAQLKILSAAYKQALKGFIWVSASNIGAAAETLNRMAAQGLFETKSEAVNVNSTIAHYRIAPTGCAAINATVISYPLETPTRLSAARSGAEFYAGSGGNGGTSPVQSDPDLEREQRQREKRIEDQLVAIVDQLKFSAERVPADLVLTEAGHAMVKRELKRIFDIARSISERLPNTKKFA